jgi:tol-pal system protein YbgF
MKCHVFILLALAILPATLTGCVTARPASDLAPVNRELVQLREEQQKLAGQVARNQAQLRQLEAKLQEQQTLIESPRRAPAPKKGAAGREIAPPPRPTVAPVPPPEGNDVRGAAAETYRQSFSNYAAGRFARASDGFETFLSKYPDHEYAGNAQYWLGECFYSEQKYDRAIEAFKRTVERYPQGSKAPDALLKMSAALNHLGQSQHAEAALEALRSRYPDSPAAKGVMRKN